MEDHLQLHWMKDKSEVVERNFRTGNYITNSFKAAYSVTMNIFRKIFFSF